MSADETGAYFRRKREEIGMSLATLSVLLDKRLSPSQLSRIERGESNARTPEWLRDAFEDAIQSYRATLSDLTAFTHVALLLKTVNAPPQLVSEQIPFLEECHTSQTWPLLHQELSQTDDILSLAAVLLGVCDDKYPEQALLVSLGEQSLWDLRVSTSVSEQEGHPAESADRWQRILKSALRHGCEVQHLFEANEDVVALFSRTAGIAELLRDTLWEVGKYYPSLANERLPADFLLVPGRGVIALLPKVEGQTDNAVFHPENSMAYRQYMASFRQIEGISTSFARVKTRPQVQEVFASPEFLKRVDDTVMIKNGVYILMVNGNILRARIQRVLSQMEIPSDVINLRVRDSLRLHHERRKAWRERVLNNCETQILSQRSVMEFLRTGQILDGLEAEVARYLKEDGQPLDEVSFAESVAFNQEERKAILQSMIDFLKFSPETYTTFFIESFADYGLDELGYMEEVPDIWWTASSACAYLVLGRPSMSEPLPILELSTDAVVSELRVFFAAVAAQIKKKAKPGELYREQQLAWLTDQMSRLP